MNVYLERDAMHSNAIKVSVIWIAPIGLDLDQHGAISFCRIAVDGECLDGFAAAVDVIIQAA